MEFKIIAPGSNEIQLINRLPTTFKGKKLPGAKSIAASAHFGDLIFQHFEGEGFDIWYSNYLITHKTSIKGRLDQPVFEMHIQFMNQFHNEWDGFSKSLLRPYQYNITYTPFVNNKVNFLAGQEYHTFDIHFTLEMLQRFAKGSAVLDKFLEKVCKAEPARISEIDRFLTPEMISIVNKILQVDLSDGLNYFFIESKVKLLLTLVLDEVSGVHPLSPIKLSDDDIQKLQKAKEIILNDFEEKISLTQLSRLVLLNEYKLKKGFKHLFGKPVFEYRRFAILSAAKDLLLNTNDPIEDIAYSAGFGHPSNFQKAFKREFKITPAELRRFHPKK